MRKILIALFALLAVTVAVGAGVTVHFLGEDGQKIQAGQLATFEAMKRDIAGILTLTGTTMLEPSRPDGIRWADAYGRGAGVTWPYSDRDSRAGASPAGATDNDEDCESETTEMCADAGHEGGSGDSQRTQHAAEDGGGCTCTQTCSDGSGAIAFVTSNEACG